MVTSPSEQPVLSSEITLRRYAAAVGVFGLLLVASTWKLWISGRSFPHIPLIIGGCGVSGWFDYLAAISILLGLLSVVVTTLCNRWQKICCMGWAFFAIGMVCTMINNQHRIQTWAFQFLVIAVLYLSMFPHKRLFWLKWFAISIYFYSATSKLDISFVNQQGGWLVDGLTSSIGLSSKHWSPSKVKTVAMLLPLSELVVAILLCITRLGKWRVLPAVAMHLLLLLTFSPWGHHQNNGVLLWNCFFIMQVIVLFGSSEHQTTEVPRQSARQLINHQNGAAFILLIMLLPLFERTGWYDTWTSWAVYAGHPEQVFIELDSAALEKLPVEIRQHAQDNLNWREDYSRLRIDRWALQSVGAPIYPESRFRVGVALYLAKRYHLENGIRIRYRSTADRFTGERSEQIHNGITEIKAFANEFSLNTEPRF